MAREGEREEGGGTEVERQGERLSETGETESETGEGGGSVEFQQSLGKYWIRRGWLFFNLASKIPIHK